MRRDGGDGRKIHCHHVGGKNEAKFSVRNFCYSKTFASDSQNHKQVGVDVPRDLTCLCGGPLWGTGSWNPLGIFLDPSLLWSVVKKSFQRGSYLRQLIIADPKSIVYIRLNLCVVSCVGLEACIMTC